MEFRRVLFRSFNTQTPQQQKKGIEEAVGKTQKIGGGSIHPTPLSPTGLLASFQSGRAGISGGSAQIVCAVALQAVTFYELIVGQSRQTKTVSRTVRPHQQIKSAALTLQIKQNTIGSRSPGKRYFIIAASTFLIESFQTFAVQKR